MTRPREARLAAAWTAMPRGQRAVALALAGWTALVVALAGADLVAGGAETGSTPLATAAAAPGTGTPSLAAIAERPLFSASRRPDAPPPTAPAPPPAAPRHRQLSLRGVYIDGTQAKAFVVSAEQPEGAWVARGGQVGGWQVAAVSAGQVRFEADGEAFSVALDPVGGHP